MANLVLLIEHDTATRRALRRTLESRGYEVVEAVTATAGLELLQRLPEAFRLVLVRRNLRGLPSAALVETLRLFHPRLPVFCLSDGPGATVEIGCPTVSAGAEELEAHLRVFAGGNNGWGESTCLDPDAVRRVRERYARTGDLVEAAHEVVRALPEL